VKDEHEKWKRQGGGGVPDALARCVFNFATAAGVESSNADRVADTVRQYPDAATAIEAASTAQEIVNAATRLSTGRDAGAPRGAQGPGPEPAACARAMDVTMRAARERRRSCGAGNGAAVRSLAHRRGGQERACAAGG
jgi:hypothetical protein